MWNNQQLIEHMIRSGVLSTPSLIDAFQRCDRIFFVPEAFHSEAYIDHPLPIGDGQTVSQPYTVAVMMELLHPQSGNIILDIGSGSGWTTALLATVVGESGFVEGTERIPALVKYGRSNLKKIPITNASIEPADPSALGKPSHFYDRILVSASAEEIPLSLLDQLNPGGILVIPVQNSIWQITKETDGTLHRSELYGFQFVPLII